MQDDAQQSPTSTHGLATEPAPSSQQPDWRSRPRPKPTPAPPSSADRDALREHRLDLLQAKLRKLWKNSLRMTQIVYCLCVVGAVLFLLWQDWAYRAAAVAAVFVCMIVWGFAKWMAPREERLRRFMVALAKHRRRCAACGYRLHDQHQARCPECGTDFDPNDDRHILSQQALQLYSHRARVMAVVNIVFVLFWVSTIVHHGEWWMHLSLAAAFAATLLGLDTWWNHQSKRGREENTRAHIPHCPSCSAVLHEAARSPHAPIPKTCPQCQHSLTYGDVFLRPDIRHLPDRRVTAIQRKVILLRWASLVGTFVGLSMYVEYRTMLTGVSLFGPSQISHLMTLILPLLVWVFLVVFIVQRLGGILRFRLKVLFAQITPHCRRCRTSLKNEPVGAPCPGCHRDVDPVDIHG